MDVSRFSVAGTRLRLPLAVLVIAILRAITRLRDLDIEIANYAVSSPLGYIWLKQNLALAAVDWPAGSADFRFTLPMIALNGFIESTGIAPESTIYIFAFAQIVLMLVGFAYLVHVMFGHAATTLALTAVMAVSPIAGVNLGNFGAGLGNGSPTLFYMWAHGFKFLALALFLRERYLLAAVFAALATWCHLTLGLFMTAFIGFALMATPRRFLNPRIVASIGLYCLLVGPLVGLFLSTAHTGTPNVSVDDWVLMSRLFNWHWHPIELGLFGVVAQIGILPLGALSLAYVIARHNVSAGAIADRMVLAGMSGMAVLTVVGILFSEVWPTPFIMKLALQRSSEILSLILLAYFVRDLVRRIEKDVLPLALLAGWSLAALVLATPGLALLPIVLFGLADALRSRRPLALVFWATLLVSGGVISSLMAQGWAQQNVPWLWTPLWSLNPFGAVDYALAGGSWLKPWLPWCALAAAVVLAVSARARNAAGLPAITVFVLSALALVTVQSIRWEDGTETRPRRVAFKAVQDWAANNTPPDAVFLGDPAVASGWREFSRRGWYGSAAELAHFATLYDSVPGLFEKGLARLKEFGVDPLALDRAKVTVPGGRYGISVLAPKLSAVFNSMTASEFVAIAGRHGIGYLLVRKDARRAPIEGLKAVYDNAFYTVYELRRS